MNTTTLGFGVAKLLSALDQLPRTWCRDLPPIRVFGSPGRDDECRDDIRTGRYRLGSVKGVVSVTAWSARDASAPGPVSPAGNQLIAITSERARTILDKIERQVDPFAEVGADTESSPTRNRPA